MAEKQQTSQKVAMLKTVQKWEMQFKSRFSYDMTDGKVCRLRCLECTKWESRIKSTLNFSSNWIRPGSNNVAKDSVGKHCGSLQHLNAMKYSKQSQLGAEAYHECSDGITNRKMFLEIVNTG